MRTPLAALILSLLATPSLADEVPPPAAQIPMMTISAEQPWDVESALKTYWKDHYLAGGEHGFGLDKVRAGRFDLNGDGKAELVLMVDDPAWEAEHGRPFLVANWTRKGWNAIGWSWGDDETLFATTEIIGGWRTIDTGTQLLRWDGRVYQRVDKPAN
ncbi:conserved exported hypothetical protein [Magnetospirillum sp. LM-5]|uniref:hypothetical protein n=1 Tax=Magnetospirillum sp. LM-5 TaxID=2681466 RepID=UPI0013812DF9|nr:hypothetical protein [Magnetospirillum sp. LM-5]CAA7621864.1 conserved exported hypothetical protein [Magnetospirillum sp. LM-5]